MTTKENIPLASESPKFGWLRSVFWPFHRHELKKLLPLVILFFAVCSNYNCVRLLKDNLAVGSAEGAKVAASFKFYGVLPGAFLAYAIYSKLTDRFNQDRVFFIMISGFVGFFLFFAFCIFPYQYYLHPTNKVTAFLNSPAYQRLNQSIDIPVLGRLLSFGPKLLYSILGGLALVVGYWTSALFFIMAELWGSVALSLLFWGFTNRICKVSESKRFYAIVSVAGNLAAIPLDWLLTRLSKKVDVLLNYEFNFKALSAQLKAAPESVAIQENLKALTRAKFSYLLNRCIGFVALNGLLILVTYWWLNRYGLEKTDPVPTPVKRESKKKKMGISESFAHVIHSPYLLSICVLVFAYGSSIQLIEIIWKDQVKKAVGDGDYMLYMSGINKYNGALTAFLGFFVGPNLVKYFGWTFTAMATPLILGSTGILFLISAYSPAFCHLLGSYFGFTEIAPFLACLGGIQSVCSKAVKYSMFDPTKEMTYIPLEPEEKSKGKAAIDVLGARMGKTSSAAVNTLLNPPGHSPIDTVPYIFVLFSAVTGFWIFSVQVLGKKFAKLTRLKDA